MTTFKTRPLFLADLRGALVSKYGIEAGEVFALKSFLGVNSGGPRLPVSKVTRTHANGFLIGDIVFGEGSHDPVKWERVLFPQRKLKAVKRTIKNSLSERGTPAQSVKGAWKANSAHFGTRGAELAPTALPRLRANTLSGTCIDNRDGTISHVEAGLMCVRAPWGMDWKDPEREPKVAAAKEELAAHVWPERGTPSATIAKLYPELSNCKMRLWTADNAQDN